MTEGSKFEDITKSLNQGGAFLQIHVNQELLNHKWPGTVIEYPTKAKSFVSNPNEDAAVKTRVSEHGMVHPQTYVKAVLKSQNEFEIEESSIDVIGSRSMNNKIVHTLCIEVKKLDPKFIDWIFFRINSKKKNMRVITRTVLKSGLVNLFKIPSMFQHFEKENYVTISEFNNWTPLEHEISDFAVATNANKIPTEYFKTDKSKIDESSRQIIQNTFALIIEKILYDINQKEPTIAQCDEIFIPIIVTNASLWFCDIEPKDIDPLTGHVTKQPNYKQLDSVIYELPNPKSIQFPEPLSSKLTTTQNILARKSHVLVLTPKGFRNFLDELDTVPNPT